MNHVQQWADYVVRHWPVLTIVATIIGWMFAVVALVGRIRAERKLKDIRRRAEAPYLIPASFTAHAIADCARFVEMQTQADKLDGLVKDVGSHGVEMRLGFANEGQKVRGVSIKRPSRVSLVCIQSVIGERLGAGYFRYVYEHDRRGKPERFTLKFESLGGFQQEHTYELIHGVRSLRRVDSL